MYQNKDIIKEAGMTRSYISTLTSLDIIIPEIKKVDGVGLAHVYSERNLQEFKTISKFKNCGFSNREIRRIYSKKPDLDKLNALLDEMIKLRLDILQP